MSHRMIEIIRFVLLITIIFMMIILDAEIRTNRATGKGNRQVQCQALLLEGGADTTAYKENC